MNWTECGIFAQNLFFGMLTSTVAGSMFLVLLLLLEKSKNYKNSRLKLPWLKTANLLFLFPIAVIFVIWRRAIFAPQGILWTSDFWRVSTAPMQKVYNVAGGIWIVGLFWGIVFRIRQYLKLRTILKGNVPMEDPLCRKMIEEYREKYSLRTVEFHQNDMISFPISTGSFRKQIILPIVHYTEKELYMVLEHEINHIKSHDLLWKKVGLFVTFIHWWNPLAYLLLEKLILQEEIECDIKTCENNRYFTMKEYGYYLSGIEENHDDMIFISALCKSKKDLFRRLEGMARAKKHKKGMAAVTCMALSVLASIPSFAAAEGFAQANERWIAQTEVAIEEQMIDYRALESSESIWDHQEIQEIDLSSDEQISVYSSTVALDRTINANTRVLYSWKTMKAGDQITIAARCNDSSVVYRIGIRDSSGTLRYVQGSGILSHTFTIDTAGSYTAYVENRSSTSMKVTGSAIYLN